MVLTTTLCDAPHIKGLSNGNNVSAYAVGLFLTTLQINAICVITVKLLFIKSLFSFVRAKNRLYSYLQHLSVQRNFLQAEKKPEKLDN